MKRTVAIALAPHLLLLGLAAAGTLGCSSSDETETETVATREELISAFVERSCGKVFECCAKGTEDDRATPSDDATYRPEFSSPDQCQHVQYLFLTREINDEGGEGEVELNGARHTLDWTRDATFDADLATRCLAAYSAASDAASCDAVSSFGFPRAGDGRTCDWALGGPVPKGGSCLIHADGDSWPDDEVCQAGLVCVGDVCTSPGAAGAACEDDDQCAEGLICNDEAKCAEAAAPKADGEACDRDSECQSGICDDVCTTEASGLICKG